MKKTVEVPIEWFERLDEIRQLAEKELSEISVFHKEWLNYLMGYLSSRVNRTKK